MIIKRLFLALLLTGPVHAQVFDRAVVVSAEPLASTVGAEVMRDGGNAVDAAVSTFFMLAVTYPQAGNLGGGGFLVLRLADGTVAALDFREVAPAAATRDMYLDESGSPQPALSQRGALASGVPGSVRGLYEAHRRYGSKPWAELLEPAIRTADAGYALPAGLADALNGAAARLREHGATSFLAPPGRRWEPGDVWTQPDLARTLRRIAERGPDGFYAGETADAVVETLSERGGLLTHDDLRRYVPVWRTPATVAYGAHELIMMPLPSSGSLVIGQVLGMAGNADLSTLAPDSPAFIHRIAEAERRAFADRNWHLGDPDFVRVPVAGLLDSTYLAQRFADFHPDRATPSAAVQHGTPPRVVESPETTHFSVVDSAGNAVALTTTLNGSFGSYVEARGAGFLMNNEMDDFSIKPGARNMFGLTGASANAIEPGKRMLSSMTPTIVLEKGELRMVLGAAGGPRIITTVLQNFLNGTAHGMDAQETVAYPRFHHQHLPEELSVEPGLLTPEAEASLQGMGHTLKPTPGANSRAHILFIRRDGKRHGAPDPRGYGTAAGF
jgi:gamma-glutamyltranspeptidase/glutathione hydrolase